MMKTLSELGRQCDFDGFVFFSAAVIVAPSGRMSTSAVVSAPSGALRPSSMCGAVLFVVDEQERHHRCTLYGIVRRARLGQLAAVDAVLSWRGFID